MVGKECGYVMGGQIHELYMWHNFISYAKAKEICDMAIEIYSSQENIWALRLGPPNTILKKKLGQ